MSIQIVPLGKKHDRSKFSCGKAPLDRYITTQVSQDIRRKLATCFVICDEQDRVIGYYTLSSAGIAKEIVVKSETQHAEFPAPGGKGICGPDQRKCIQAFNTNMGVVFEDMTVIEIVTAFQTRPSGSRRPGSRAGSGKLVVSRQAGHGGLSGARASKSPYKLGVARHPPALPSRMSAGRAGDEPEDEDPIELMAGAAMAGDETLGQSQDVKVQAPVADFSGENVAPESDDAP